MYIVYIFTDVFTKQNFIRKACRDFCVKLSYGRQGRYKQKSVDRVVFPCRSYDKFYNIKVKMSFKRQFLIQAPEYIFLEN